MPVAQQDQWQHDLSDQTDDGSIGRLETALMRIAAAAGRRQDELRSAELTARTAHHEAELLARAETQRLRDEAARGAAADAAAAATRRDELQMLALRIEGLIETLQAAVGHAAAEPVPAAPSPVPASGEG